MLVLRDHPLRALAVVAALAVPVIVAGAAVAAERHAVPGSSVAIYNLAGRLTVEAGTGSEVAVEIATGGSDAARLRVEQGPVGRWQTLRVVYPSSRVRYAALGFFNNTQVRVGDDGRFDDTKLVGDAGDRHRVNISAHGGLDAYADLRVSVPRGRTLGLFLGVGNASVTNVDGELTLSLGSADAVVRGTRGSLAVDAGSGEVRVSDAAGTISLDTGSGSTRVQGVRGDTLSLDTGSGELTVSDAEVDVLSADTGSGGVEIADLVAQEISLDSGSGSVKLALLPGAPRSIVIDSGSGGVTLAVPPGLDAAFEVETGSGGIDIGVPHEVLEHSHDAVRGRFGNGRGHIHIESGSGGIRIVPSRATRRGLSGSR